jgi:hypothetical protein
VQFGNDRSNLVFDALGAVGVGWLSPTHALAICCALTAAGLLVYAQVARKPEPQLEVGVAPHYAPASA